MKFKMRKMDNNNFDQEYDILVLGVTSSSNVREHRMPLIQTKSGKKDIKFTTSAANSNSRGVGDVGIPDTEYHEIEFIYKDNDADDRTRLETFFDGSNVGDTTIELIQKDNVEIYASYDEKENGYDPPASDILIKDLEFGEY